MISKLLFAYLLFLSGFLSAQNLELVQYKGQPSVDILFDNDEDNVKLSALTHVAERCNPQKWGVSIAFSAHITNSGSQVMRQVQFKADHFSKGQFARSLISPVIDSLVPGDTTLYSQTLTDSILSTQIHADDFFMLSIQSLNFNSGILDTVYLSVLVDSFYRAPISTDFENYNNTFTTDSLGFDGYGYAFLLPFEGRQDIVGLGLPFGSNTLPRGDLQLQLYDSAAFDDSNGTFNGSPVFTEFFSIPSGFNTGPQKTYMYWQTPTILPISACSKKKYWCVLTFYSNGGFDTIELYNDTTVIQPDAACLVYTKSTSQWVPISQGPGWLQNPSFTILVNNPVFDSISVSRYSASFRNSLIYPNPARTYFKIQGVSGATATVKVYDANGHEVLYQPEIHHHQAIPLSNLPKGLYMVQVLQKEQVIHSQKLMVQP